MKKYLIFSSIAILFVSSATAQTAVQYKEVDYLTDNGFTTPLKLKAGSRIGIKINNINKKMVDIGKDVKTTNFNDTPPALFDVFSKTTITEPKASASNPLAPGNTDLVDLAKLATSNLPDSLKGKIRDLNTKYNTTAISFLNKKAALVNYLQVYSRIKYVVIYQSDLGNLQNICDKPFSDILTAVADLTLATFNDPKMNMSQAERNQLSAKNYITNRGILNRYVITTLDVEQTDYDLVTQEFLPSKMDEMNTATAKYKESALSILGVIARLRAFTPNADAKAVMEGLKDNGLANEFTDLKQTYATNDNVKYHANADNFRLTGKRDLFNTYNYFTVSNWTYYVDPQTIDSDLTVFSVNITPKADVTCTAVARSYELRVRANSGLKIDFSTGLFVNFGGHNFLDQSYRYDTVTGHPDQTRVVHNNTKNSIFPSVGALMHIYARNGKEVAWSGTFGISTKDLEKVNYHLGASIIFGHDKRFIITSGVTLTKATLIDDNYADGQIIDKATAPTTIPTSSFSRLGFFAAFTYNLSSK